MSIEDAGDVGTSEPDDVREKIIESLRKDKYQTARHLHQNTLCSIDEVMLIAEIDDAIGFQFVGGLTVYYLKENAPHGRLVNSGDNSFVVSLAEAKAPPKKTVSPTEHIRLNLAVVEKLASEGKTPRAIAKTIGVPDAVFRSHVDPVEYPDIAGAWKRGVLYFERQQLKSKASPAKRRAISNPAPESIEFQSVSVVNDTTGGYVSPDAAAEAPADPASWSEKFETLATVQDWDDLVDEPEPAAEPVEGKTEVVDGETEVAPDAAKPSKGRSGSVALKALGHLPEIESLAAEGQSIRVIAETIGVKSKSLFYVIMRAHRPEIRAAYNRGRKAWEKRQNEKPAKKKSAPQAANNSAVVADCELSGSTKMDCALFAPSNEVEKNEQSPAELAGWRGETAKKDYEEGVSRLRARGENPAENGATINDQDVFRAHIHGITAPPALAEPVTPKPILSAVEPTIKPKDDPDGNCFAQVLPLTSGGLFSIAVSMNPLTCSDDELALVMDIRESVRTFQTRSDRKLKEVTSYGR